MDYLTFEEIKQSTDTRLVEEYLNYYLNGRYEYRDLDTEGAYEITDTLIAPNRDYIIEYAMTGQYDYIAEEILNSLPVSTKEKFINNTNNDNEMNYLYKLFKNNINIKNISNTNFVSKYLNSFIYNEKFDKTKPESIYNIKYVRNRYQTVVDYAMNGEFKYLATNILKFLPNKIKWNIIKWCPTNDYYDFIFNFFNLDEINVKECFNIKVFNNVKTMYEIDNSVLERDLVYEATDIETFKFIVKELRLRFSQMPNPLQEDEIVIGKFKHLPIVEYIINNQLYPVNEQLLLLVKSNNWRHLIKQFLDDGKLNDRYGKLQYIFTNNLPLSGRVSEDTSYSYKNDKNETVVVENGFRYKNIIVDENNELWDDIITILFVESKNWYQIDYILQEKQIDKNNENKYVQKITKILADKGIINRLAVYFNKYNDFDKSGILRKLKLWNPKEYEELQRMMTFRYNDSGLDSKKWKESTTSNPFGNTARRQPEWLAGFLKQQGKKLDPEKQKKLYEKYPMTDTFPEKEVEKIYVPIKPEETKDLKYKPIDIYEDDGFEKL